MTSVNLLLVSLPSLAYLNFMCFLIFIEVRDYIRE
jgi:hypothetical protein